MSCPLILSLPVVLALFTLTACATGPMVMIDGIEMRQNKWDKTTEELGRNASFDLGCNGALEFRLLEKAWGMPSRVGVTGCGKRITYHRIIAQNVGILPWQANVVSTDGQ